MKSDNVKLEYREIIDLSKPNSTALDLGCGDGELLWLLTREKKIKGQGIEIDEQEVYKCVAKGLNVFHGDIDDGLSEYADGSFDYVILNQTFQQVKSPEVVIDEALRVGKQAIVGVPNFTHYSARYQLFFKGRTPITSALPYQWYNTPNRHFLSLSDFIRFCNDKNIDILDSRFVDGNKRVRLLPNLLADIGIFLIQTNMQ